MADQFDRAQELDARYRRQALDAHRSRRPQGESRTHCLDCGEAIPEARRLAVPGCRYCIDCAEEHERKERK
ncbi:MAG: TraR/DksA C4-type zinc finger protein [Desulfocapsaceae bacterium]|nr:TraR/DksA C4-type zinc finger protein [Desulfocapsaceae bacterium]